jgi:glycosyltransferase involved in cell wall biosynthesis
LSLSTGAVPEIVEDGLTGFIVEDETSAVGAIGQLSALTRERVHARFDERFTARRMASEYLAVYRKLADAAGPQLRLATA